MIDFKGITDSVTGLFRGAGDAVTDVVSVAKDKLPPEEAVKVARLEADTKMALAKLEVEAVENFRKFVHEYEQPEKQPGWLLTVKAFVRPLFSYFFIFQLFYISGLDFLHMVVWKTEEYVLMVKRMPSEWWWMLGIVLTFWFGERAVSHAMDRIKQPG